MKELHLLTKSTCSAAQANAKSKLMSASRTANLIIQTLE
jgi:hypothetical protein